MPSQNRCPAPCKLADFLSGSLEPEQVSVLESHLSECSPCNDTLLGLGSNDTFEQLAIEAFGEPASDAGMASQFDRANIDLIAANAKAWTQGSPPNSQATGTAEVEQAFDTDESNHSIGILGQFRIDELIGSGSSGVVYLATDTTLNRQVALKILRPSLGDAAKARFLAEAKAAAAMDHLNVVSIHQVGVEKGMAFIAMKWTRGETLASRMANEEPMTVEEIRSIGSQIAAGLAAAHKANLIHRDIKPANIWLEESTGNVKILDFGLVRATDEEVSLTLTGMLAGTPSYMSPEQARGAELDSRSDLFSLGCVLYQMLTGKLPFHGNNVLAMLQSVQKDTPLHPREFDEDAPEDLSALAMSLLQKSPDSRPPSAAMVAAAIHSEPSDWPFVASVQPRLDKLNRRWNPLVLAGVVVAASFVGLAAFFAPQIIRIATDQGLLQIETFDPNIKIEVTDAGGEVRVIDLKTDQSFDIKSGTYELRPVNDDNSIEIDRNTIVMTRGSTEIVRVTRSELMDVPEQDIVSTSQGDTPEISNGKHVLQPGDIIGIDSGDVQYVRTDDDYYPLIVNANFEIASTEFVIENLEGRQVWELPILIREAVKKNAKKVSDPWADNIAVKLLRKCPSQGDLPDTNSKVNLYVSVPSHSQQIAEALRYHKILGQRLLEKLGDGHPSLVSNDSSIAKLKQLYIDSVLVEKRIISEKEHLLLQNHNIVKELSANGFKVDERLHQTIGKLNLEIFQLEKAQLAKDLHWILLSDLRPSGIKRHEQKQFLQSRIDTIRERAKQKTGEYTSRRKEMIAAGWNRNLSKPKLLDRYSNQFIPMILKSIESKEGLASAFQYGDPNIIDVAFPLSESSNWVPTARIQLVSASEPQGIVKNATACLFRYHQSGFLELVSKSSVQNGIIEYEDLFLGFKSQSTYRLMLHADGYASQQVSLMPITLESQSIAGLGTGDITHHVSFVAAATLNGTVVDHDGNPVEGATVYRHFHPNGDPITQFESEFSSAKTGKDGTFSIEDLSAFDAEIQRLWIHVRHPQFGPQYVNVEKIPGDVRIKLDPPTHVKFRVIDKDSREPVADYKVAAQATNTSVNVNKNEHVGPGHWIEATSDSDGWVQLIAPSTGSYNISHMAGPDQARYPRAIELKSGIVGSVTLDPMELETAATITGNVVDENGKPVPNIFISWYGPDRPKSSAMVRSVKTDASGIFKAKVVPGANRFYVSLQGWRADECRIFNKGTWGAYSEFAMNGTEHGSIDVKLDSSWQMQFVVSREEKRPIIRDFDGKRFR